MTVARTDAPASLLEREGRRMHDTHAGDAKPADMAVGVVIGRTSESFDFLVYAIASVVVFPSHVFPYVDALTGMLFSLAIFSLAFLARPQRRCFAEQGDCQSVDCSRAPRVASQ